MMLDEVMLRGIFEHEQLKPATIRTNQGNINNLAEFETNYEHRNKIGTVNSTFLTRGAIIMYKSHSLKKIYRKIIAIVSIMQLHR